MSDTPDLAAPDTLLGLLQRGRGKGYLLALKAPPDEVWPLLFECLTNDPRIDRECESRHEYYADLAMAVGMNLEPLRSYLKKASAESGDVTLVLDTLQCLAEERENVQAAAIVEEYLSYGEAWEYVLLFYLVEAIPPGLVAALGNSAQHDSHLRSEFGEFVRREWQTYRSSTQDSRDHGKWLLPICEPWKTICQTNRRLVELFAVPGIDYDQPGPPGERPPKPDLSALSLEDLFSQVNESNRRSFHRATPEKTSIDHESFLLEQLSSADPLRMPLAFIGLGTLGTPKAFEAVRSWIEACDESVAHPIMRGWAFDAFCSMPGSLTLDVARQWFRSYSRWTQFAAVRVLASHATVEDIPLLSEVLRMSEIASREDRRLSFALEAFKRFKGIGRVAELENAFCCVGQCYDRHRAAEAMEATAPDHFGAEYALECLWDCHWDTRALGCKTVSLSIPGVLSRLRELAANPNESETVREAAQARLEELNGRNDRS